MKPIIPLQKRCQSAIELGYTYDPETGKIFGIKPSGKEITAKNNAGYILIKLERKYILLGHHFAWYYMYKECIEQIDHIDTTNPNNKSDNRKCNLRNANGHNAWNLPNVKGCCYKKIPKKWYAYIMVNGKNIHLGCFDTEEEAHQAYLDAKIKYHIF